MKKQLLIAILCLSMLTVVLAGCSDKENTGSDGGGSSSSSSAGSNAAKGDFDYTIEINGVAHNFPMTYAEFKALGWQINHEDGDANKSMPAAGDGTFGSSEDLYYSNGDIKNAKPHFLNPSETERTPVADCMVTGIVIEEEFRYELPVGCAVLSKGITIGKSTYDETLAAYGEPAQNNDTILIYGEDHFVNGLFLEYNYEGVLISIHYLKTN